MLARVGLLAIACIRLSVCMLVCMSVSVSQKSEFYRIRNGWTNRASFWHGSVLPPILHCVEYFPLKSWKFCFGISIVETCYQLSSTMVDANSVINWTVVCQMIIPTSSDSTTSQVIVKLCLWHDTVACAGQLATADTCFRQSLQQTNTRQAFKSTEVDHLSNLSNQTRTHRIPIYRVGQKSKLSILSVYNVNKTQKTGGTWTNSNSNRESEALSDISREIFTSQLFYV